MSRLLSVVAFVAIVAVSCGASLVDNVVVRQPVVPEDVIGTFRLAVTTDAAPTCPQVITHTETIGEGETELSHSVMSQNSASCDDGGVMTIYSDPREVKTVVTARGRSLVNRLLESSGVFIWGVELDGRDCDGDFPAFQLAEQTLVVLVNPEERVTGVLDLIPGSRYMIIDDPTRETSCIYIAPLRDAESTAPPAETPDDDSDDDDDDTNVDGVVVPAIPVPVPVNGTRPPATSVAVPVVPVATTFVPTTTVVVTTVPDDDSDTEEPGSTPQSSLEASLEASAEAAADGEVTDDDDDGSVCFPASAVVEVEGGATKLISDVELGDRLKVGNGIYSDVFMFTHKDSSAVYDFVRLETTSGQSLSATKGHYIYINGVVAAAGSAKAGDVLDLGDGSKSMINKVSTVQSTGLFNPQTVHGDIIVNSVRATTFTRTIEPATAQAMLAPFRMMYDAFGWSSRILDNGADLIAQAFPKGQASF